MLIESFRIIGTSNCDIGCDYCDMRDEFSDLCLDRDKLDVFLSKNKDILPDNVRFMSGEKDVDYMISWLKYLSHKFKYVNYTTKLLLNEDDVNILKNVLSETESTLTVSWNVGLDNDNIINTIKRNILTLKKYISDISFVLSKDSLMQLPTVYKFCHENYIRLVIIPMFSFSEEIEPATFDDILRTLNSIYDEIGLIMLNDYRSMLFNTAEMNEFKECNSKTLSILPNGDIYQCPLQSPIFDKNEQILEFKLGNISDYEVDDVKLHKCIKMNDECIDCNVINCNGKCSIYNNRSWNFKSFCNYQKALYRIYKSHQIDILRPKVIMPILTYDCNFKCKYCFEHSKSSKSCGYMNKDTMINLIKYGGLMDQSVNISLFGGEPTLNIESLQTIKDFINDNYIPNLTFEMETNFYNLTDEIINFIKFMEDNTNFILSVSYDGCENSSINRITQSNELTHDRVLNNIKKIRELCPNLFINTHAVITSDSVPYLEEIFDNLMELQSNGVISNWGMNWVDPDTPGFEIDQETFDQAAKIYHEKILPKFKDKFKFTSINSINVMRLDINIYDRLNDYPGLHEFDTCGAGLDLIGITPNGTIIPCHKFMDKKISDWVELNFQENINNYNFGIPKNNIIPNNLSRDITETPHYTCGEYNCVECSLSLYCKFCFGTCKIYGNGWSDNGPNACKRAQMLIQAVYPYKEKELTQKIRNALELENKLLKELNELMIENINLDIK